MAKQRYNILRIVDGSVRAYNEAGNPGPIYYQKNRTRARALRAYWYDESKGLVEVYLDNDDVWIMNSGGNIYRMIK